MAATERHDHNRCPPSAPTPMMGSTPPPDGAPVHHQHHQTSSWDDRYRGRSPQQHAMPPPHEDLYHAQQQFHGHHDDHQYAALPPHGHPDEFYDPHHGALHHQGHYDEFQYHYGDEQPHYHGEDMEQYDEHHHDPASYAEGPDAVVPVPIEPKREKVYYDYYNNAENKGPGEVPIIDHREPFHSELKGFVQFFPFPFIPVDLPSMSGVDLEDMTRIFIGQVPEQLSGVVFTWMFSKFSKGAQVFDIQRIFARNGHTRVRTFQDCCTASTDPTNTETIFKTMHKRVLFDHFGVWYAQNNREIRRMENHCKQLQRMQRPFPKSLPRFPMTVESARSSYRRRNNDSSVSGTKTPIRTPKTEGALTRNTSTAALSGATPHASEGSAGTHPAEDSQPSTTGVAPIPPCFEDASSLESTSAPAGGKKDRDGTVKEPFREPTGGTRSFLHAARRGGGDNKSGKSTNSSKFTTTRTTTTASGVNTPTKVVKGAGPPTPL